MTVADRDSSSESRSSKGSSSGKKGLAKRCILVRNIPSDTTEERLGTMFQQMYGLKPTRTALLLDDSGRAMLEFSTRESVQSILKGQQSDILLKCPWMPSVRIRVQVVDSDKFAHWCLSTRAAPKEMTLTTGGATKKSPKTETSSQSPPAKNHHAVARKCIYFRDVPEDTLKHDLLLMFVSMMDSNDLEEVKRIVLFDDCQGIAEFVSEACVTQIMKGASKVTLGCPWASATNLTLESVKSEAFAVSCLKHFQREASFSTVSIAPPITEGSIAKTCIYVRGAPNNTTEMKLFILLTVAFRFQVDVVRVGLLDGGRAVVQFTESKCVNNILRTNPTLPCPWQPGAVLDLQSIRSEKHAQTCLEDAAVFNHKLSPANASVKQPSEKPKQAKEGSSQVVALPENFQDDVSSRLTETDDFSRLREELDDIKKYLKLVLANSETLSGGEKSQQGGHSSSTEVSARSIGDLASAMDNASDHLYSELDRLRKQVKETSKQKHDLKSALARSQKMAQQGEQFGDEAENLRAILDAANEKATKLHVELSSAKQGLEEAKKGEKRAHDLLSACRQREESLRDELCSTKIKLDLAEEKAKTLEAELMNEQRKSEHSSQEVARLEAEVDRCQRKLGNMQVRSENHPNNESPSHSASVESILAETQAILKTERLKLSGAEYKLALQKSSGNHSLVERIAVNSQTPFGNGTGHSTAAVSLVNFESGAFAGLTGISIDAPLSASQSSNDSSSLEDNWSQDSESRQRCEAELRELQSSHSPEELWVCPSTGCSTVICRRLFLPESKDGQDAMSNIPVDLTLTMPPGYPLRVGSVLQLEAALVGQNGNSSSARKCALNSLSRLVATCQWEARAHEGKEAVASVLAFAENWVHNDWPAILEKYMEEVSKSAANAADNQ